MKGKRIRDSYEHTITASYLGYITQAIINNFAPLLFLTFQTQYKIPFDRIGLLVTINFGIQLLVDLLAARYVDKIGYRRSIVAAHALAAAGLVGLAVLPDLLENAYAGMLFATALYAVGGGLIEVLVSPIVEACPTKKKEAAMSLLHSFYCWGHVFVVLVSTAFFRYVGITHWKWLALLWAVIPALNLFYFSKVPLAVPVEEGKGMPVRRLLGDRLFWLFALLMVCAGASEQGMSQWASAFAEAGLGVSKTVGDLLGPCTFALLMGTSRALYAKFSEKLSLRNAMLGSSLLCIASYLMAAFAPHPVIGLAGCALCGLSVGILWPGTYSMASVGLPLGGIAMFAFFALAGDFGCSVGPTLVGFVSEQFGANLKRGILAATLFPVILTISILLGGSHLRLKKKE